MPDGINHYQGEPGQWYFAAKFGNDMELGRIWQTRYFRPYCAEDQTLLDLGCAHGLFLRALPARRRIGVEVNPVALARCRELCDETGISIELHEQLETVESEAVDVAISNHCLEHMPHPLRALGELLRILKPGGRLVLVTPFDDFRMHGGRTWRPGEPNHHLYTWNPLNLGNLLDEAGFEVKEVRLNRRAWSPQFFAIHRLLGETMFDLTCAMYSLLTHRQEVFCLAQKG